MDEREHLILVHGENKTREIQDIRFNPETQRYDVTYSRAKSYPYGVSSIVWYKNPLILDPALYRISSRGRQLYNISGIFCFGENNDYWHIVFSGRDLTRTYRQNELDVSVSCLSEAAACNTLEYLREIATINELKGDDGEALLKKQYERLSFVGRDSALALYLNPQEHPIKTKTCDFIIFPFGGNASQFKAVRNALTNQISVIQGPPGTGKTQTILNIIANLLIQGCTVEVVSNNNSATKNVLEKLASPSCGLDFLVAFLGKQENKAAFVESQSGLYPDLTMWEKDAATMRRLSEQIDFLAKELWDYFSKQEELALAKQELSSLELETRYFEEYYTYSTTPEPEKHFQKTATSKVILKLLQEIENCLERKNKISLFLKIQSSFYYRLFEWRYFKNGHAAVISYLQSLFYHIRHNELEEKIDALEGSLKNADADKKLQQLTRDSLDYLRAILYRRYGGKERRECFEKDDLWRFSEKVLREYPVVLSTTFSARSSLSATYDYVIMDEASQVDLATGALALSCAKNAVIVGDLKQLPNVIPDLMKKRSDTLFRSYCLSAGYSFSDNSFLKSICTIFPEIPSTLLREHYRCHPRIIDFCNQKFYHGELLIMTEDHNEPDTLSVYQTVAGAHQRGHINQRQIDVITQEVLPRLKGVPDDKIGIIAPYRDQVSKIASCLGERKIEVDTVHKFQGREKETILLTTVDDEVTDFSDDPYLLNVAISRAKKKLCLIVSGNGQPQNSNIQDLIAYIKYHNFSVVNSEVYSVFDLLYQQYTAQRLEFLSKHRKISQYDSENIMYGALTDLLKEFPEEPLSLICHQQARMLVKNIEMLTEDERQYIRHPNTHVDFLIYDRLSKEAVLAIEVDGFHFHKPGTAQAERDKLKDSIFSKCKIPLLRLPTNGSGEIGKIQEYIMRVSRPSANIVRTEGSLN